MRAHVNGQTRGFIGEEILVATGRDLQTVELDFEAAEIQLAEGRVQINEHLQTTCPHIFAGGDVSGPFQFHAFRALSGPLAGWNMLSGEPRPAAGEMIHESVVSMKAHERVSAIAEATHAYPTLAEWVKVAAYDRLEERS